MLQAAPEAEEGADAEAEPEGFAPEDEPEADAVGRKRGKR
jgi:hypothetical protein